MTARPIWTGVHLDERKREPYTLAYILRLLGMSRNRDDGSGLRDRKKLNKWPGKRAKAGPTQSNELNDVSNA